MKQLVATLVLLSGITANAGDKVGNGGGLWTCSMKGSLMSAHLVDLYEAKEELGLDPLITFETDPMKIVQERSDFVRLSLPEYSPEWNRLLGESMGKIRFVNSELVVVEDALYRLKPAAVTCSEPWIYTQFANYTSLDQVLIRADLWTSFQVPALHKAALIWHEVIYKWLRDTKGDEDSVRARQLVGILFSTLSPAEMNITILKVLSQGGQNPPPPPPPKPQWICMVHNPHISQYYAKLGDSELEARTLTIQACQNGRNGFFCDSQVKCEENRGPDRAYTCDNKNPHTNKIYSGQGRSLLEAEFKARNECQKNVEYFFCSEDVNCI